MAKCAVDAASIIDDDNDDDDDDDDTTSSVTGKWNKDDDYNDIIAKDEYELIMRDSVIVSNLASIASGYLAHVLAAKCGPVGPFQGAVTCTGIALIVVSLLWTENYGVASTTVVNNEKEDDGDEDHQFHPHKQDRCPSSKSVRDYIVEAMAIFRSDPKILYLGIVQGLSAGSLQIFIFLWSPTLQKFSSSDSMSMSGTSGIVSPFPSFDWAMDGYGNPAYGLIFGAFMAAGVAGGLCEPYVRQAVALLFSQEREDLEDLSSFQTVHIEAEGTNVRPMALEFLVGMNYIFSAVLMLIPCMLPTSSPESFSIALAAFLTYEFLVGVTMPCEGVIRSLYLPSEGRATMMTVPRMVVNLVVSLGVLLTKYIP